MLSGQAAVHCRDSMPEEGTVLGAIRMIICYNLGLVHLTTGQYVTAFNYFSATINLRPSFAHAYMYLGVTLARLGDMDNAYHAYQRALEKDLREPVFYLNFGMPQQPRFMSS